MQQTDTTSHDFKLIKRKTGIPSLDAITRGGFPAKGATLVLGAPGCGKTILGLQILASAIERNEGGLFMSFEESKEQICRDASSFSWGEPLLDSTRFEIIDAHSAHDVESSGAFDLNGLLAVIGMCMKRIDGSWLVLDGIDQLLSRQPDNFIAVDQISNLNDWCEQQGYTLLLTGKHRQNDLARIDHLEGIEFLLSTVIVLTGQLEDKRLTRRFRIAKYRGASHDTDELPMVISDDGIHLPYGERFDASSSPANHERVSTGVARLDEVLGGGLYRGSALLISGHPGTSKTTLAAAFVEATCQRGERALFFSFDEPAPQIVRNVASVGIELQPHIDAGKLRLESRASWSSLVEEHYMALQQALDTFQPSCLVIDPASALLKTTATSSAYLALEHILARTRLQGITLLMTSLSEADDPAKEATLSQASTLADTWLVLRYQVQSGERNRSLSVVKSRGTAHSNQVRELLISSSGIDLADPYQYGSEVLMGSARVEKEREEATTRLQNERERAQRRRLLQLEIEKLHNQVVQHQTELEHLQEALKEEEASQESLDREASLYRDLVIRRRGAGHVLKAEGPLANPTEGGL